MRIRTVVGSIIVAVLSQAGCGDDDPDPLPPLPERDSGMDASARGCENRSLDLLQQSRARWADLAAMSGDTYWYEEENCRVNSVTGELARVQIEAGKVGTKTVRQLERADCEGRINRYEDLAAKTFEELYDLCEKLLESRCEARFFTDELGVLESCSFHTDPPACFDNCGEGVHVRRWAFGVAPAS